MFLSWNCFQDPPELVLKKPQECLVLWTQKSIQSPSPGPVFRCPQDDRPSGRPKKQKQEKSEFLERMRKQIGLRKLLYLNIRTETKH